MLRILSLCVLIWSAIWMPATGVAYAATSQAPTAAHQNAPGDVEIERTIEAKLAKSKIGKDGFKFHVSHGIVTWEGTTNVIQHKGSATRMAKAAGAVKVVNNIQVSAAAKAKAAQGLRKASVQEN